MNDYVNSEFCKAFYSYKTILKQYRVFLIIEQALFLMVYYKPEQIKAEMNTKAKELKLLPSASGYRDEGEPMYQLEDIAKYLYISFEDNEQHLFQIIDNRQKVVLPNDGALISLNINTNYVQLGIITRLVLDIFLGICFVICCLILATVSRSAYANLVHSHSELVLAGYQISTGAQSKGAFFVRYLSMRSHVMAKLGRDIFICAGHLLSLSANPFQLCHLLLGSKWQSSFNSTGVH